MTTLIIVSRRPLGSIVGSDGFIVFFWISIIMLLTFGLIKLIRHFVGVDGVRQCGMLASDIHPSVVVL